MARPSMGAEARTVQGGLKISKQEEALLIETHGSVGKGLRAALDRHVKAVLAIKSPTRDVAKGFGVTDAQIADDIARTLVPHEHQGHPMLDDDVAAAAVNDLEVTHALALDAVAQALPDRGTEPAPHRHRRGERIAAEFANGVKTAVYACTAPGCTVELR